MTNTFIMIKKQPLAEQVDFRFLHVEKLKKNMFLKWQEERLSKLPLVKPRHLSFPSPKFQQLFKFQNLLARCAVLKLRTILSSNR